MPSTVTLQGSINYAQPFVRYKPLLDTNNQPGFDNANRILQTMLAPPFCWRWNRKIAPATITTVAGTQDYAKTISDFGFLEKAVSVPAAGKARELTIKNVMAQSNSGEEDAPEFIGSVLDDNSGSITFRVLPVPDAVYTITLVYQMKPVLFVATSGTWAPVPDEYSYIYNAGFIGLGMEFFDDPRAKEWQQRFALSLLGVSEGLDDTQKNLFLGNYLTTLKQDIRASAGSQQAMQARAV